MLISLIMIACSKQLSRKVPVNYALLLTFTVCMSYFVMIATSHYDPHTVILAAGLTAMMVIALAFYALFTKVDLSILFGACILIVVSMIVCGVSMVFTFSPVAYTIYCGLGALLFGIYIIYDIKVIICNPYWGLSTDDYIIGAIILYMDIIQLFLFILRLLASKK